MSLRLRSVSLRRRRKRIFSESVLSDTAALKRLNMITQPLQDFTELLQLTLNFVAFSFVKLQSKLKHFDDNTQHDTAKNKTKCNDSQSSGSDHCGGMNVNVLSCHVVEYIS